ncbi:hypothetical protein [Tardiphaga sp.]|uniref:hypothetical protein n=1 Tax=Tardiphaga sp. TaxID=1926292 RepID=UPI0037D9C3DD
MKIFTLEIDGRPTLVFDAASIEEANGICALPEFRADLGELKRQGQPLFGDVAVFAARAATALESAAFNHAVMSAGPADGPTMAFLVPVDGMVVTIIQPE